MIFKTAPSWTLRLLLPGLCLIILLISGCSRDALGVGSPAPEFILSDMTGRSESLSFYRGHVVLIEFWATWCQPCQEAIPEMTALHEKYSDKGVVIFAISVDDNASDVTPFIKEHKITYPVFLDDKDINNLYKVTSIPMTFLIDKNGKITNKYYGYVEGMSEKLSKEIEALL